MLARQISFSSSWKQLTRDKGWIKPLLILGLVAWIPILGEIVVFGYGFEWARLSAWGVDAAPKQRGVNYSKMFSTGGRTFLVMLSMRAVLLALPVLMFSFDPIRVPVPFIPMGEISYNTISVMRSSGPLYPFLLIVLLVLGVFMTAASMRATIYDRFSAGWRLDRLLQMISRDISGFLNAFAVALVASAIVFLYVVVTGIAAVGVSALLLRMLDILRYSTGHSMITALFTFGAVPLLLIIVLAILTLYVLSVIGVTMQLISIHAVGQWFGRFDVGRWGVSSAPLPADVVGPADVGSAPVPPAVPPAPAAAPCAPVPSAESPHPTPEPAPAPGAPAESPSQDNDGPRSEGGSFEAPSGGTDEDGGGCGTSDADRTPVSPERDADPSSATMREIPSAPCPRPEAERADHDDEPRDI